MRSVPFAPVSPASPASAAPSLALPLGLAWPLALMLAFVPALIAFNEPPAASLYLQLGAAAAWALVLAAQPVAWRVAPATAAPAAAIALVGLAALYEGLLGPLPYGIMATAAASLLLALLALLGGAAAGTQGRGSRLADALFIGCIAVGALSAAIALLQVLAPAWPDGTWIAKSTLPGRGFGNMRQPNLLAALLLWSLAATVALVDARRLKAWAGGGLAVLMAAGIAVSGSRTGALGIVVIVLWCAVDRRLSPAARRTPTVALAALAAALGALAVSGAPASGVVAAVEVARHGDLSSSRFAVWRDTLALIGAHPWRGVGFGEFNFAWTLTPSPHRPPAFFDNAHNLPLHLAAELGIPLALLVCALLVLALVQAWRRSGGHADVYRRTAVLMLLLVALHSLLEYPLWYLLFLLPTAWLLGFCLSAPEEASASPRRALLPRVAGVLTLALTLFALQQYRLVVQVFAPAKPEAPLLERIEASRKAWFFGHFADYAAGVFNDLPGLAMPTFDRSAHYLLDARLLQAWAIGYSQHRDWDRARFLAHRLREFRNPESVDFFKVCDNPEAAPHAFQCDATDPPLGLDAFR